LGLQTEPAGSVVPLHGVPSATIEHRPVIGSQHGRLVGGHVTPTHVEPKPKNWPLQAVAADTMKHPYTPAAFRAQHAPDWGGGQVTPAHVEPNP
jgi:hypothetical protein